jgi:hypothetical protein
MARYQDGTQPAWLGLRCQPQKWPSRLDLPGQALTFFDSARDVHFRVAVRVAVAVVAAQHDASIGATLAMTKGAVKDSRR